MNCFFSPAFAKFLQNGEEDAADSVSGSFPSVAHVGSISLTKCYCVLLAVGACSFSFCYCHQFLSSIFRKNATAVSMRFFTSVSMFLVILLSVYTTLCSIRRRYV